MVLLSLFILFGGLIANWCWYCCLCACFFDSLCVGFAFFVVWVDWLICVLLFDVNLAFVWLRCLRLTVMVCGLLFVGFGLI